MNLPFVLSRASRTSILLAGTVSIALSLPAVPYVWAQSSETVLPEPPSRGENPNDELVLEGVIVAATPSDSVALVRSSGAARGRVLRIGQDIEGYVLVEVTKGSARFQSRDRDLRLTLSGERVESALPARSGVPPGGVADDEGWIRHSIPRASAKERLSREISVILEETDVAPRVEEGEVTGLRVSRLPEGTLLAETGLRPGDVVVSVNGEPLRGVDSLWALFSRLLDQDEIRVIVRRKGDTLKLAYDFTN